MGQVHPRSINHLPVKSGVSRARLGKLNLTATVTWYRAPCMLFCLIIVPPSSQNVRRVLKIYTSSVCTVFVHFMCLFCVLCWSSTAHNVISLISLTPLSFFHHFPSPSLFSISPTQTITFYLFFYRRKVNCRFVKLLWNCVFWMCRLSVRPVSVCCVTRSICCPFAL